MEGSVIVKHQDLLIDIQVVRERNESRMTTPAPTEGAGWMMCHSLKRILA